MAKYTDKEYGGQPKGNIVLMSNGSWKDISEVKVGDKVISPQANGSNTFSKVTNISSNLCEDIYQVSQLNREKKKLYSCSSRTLIPINYRYVPRINKIRYRNKSEWRVKNYSAEYYINLSRNSKQNQTGILSYPINKFESIVDSNIDPYFLGVWLGDGSFCQSLNITSEDQIIINELSDRGIYPMSISKKRDNNNSIVYYYSSLDDVALELKRLNLRYKRSGTKFIPRECLLSSIAYRKELLAGIIDTDGHCVKGQNNYEITLKSKKLIEDIYTIIKSLGYRGTIHKVKKTIKSINFTGEYYMIIFYIGSDILPLKLTRKKSSGNCFYLSPNRYSIDIKINKNRGLVYGITIDSKSSLYITNDYSVIHDCNIDNIYLGKIGRTKRQGIIQ